VTDRGKTDLMRGFWDEKAAENAMYYVSSYRPYGEEDADEFWQWGRTLAERFLRESGIAFTGAESVLEIGCGIGRMTAYLAGRFARVCAVDVSPNMIEQARANLAGLDNVRLDVGNGYDLSNYDDAQFDFVFSYLVFQHIPDRDATITYIREAGRVLKPGGHFYFQVNNMKQPLRARLRLRTRLKSLVGGRRAAVHGAPHDLTHPAWQGSRLSLREIRRACAAGGMRVVHVTGEGDQYTWVKAVRP